MIERLRLRETDTLSLWPLTERIYKVVSASDGMAYALRRVDNVRMSNDIAAAALALWSR